MRSEVTRLARLVRFFLLQAGVLTGMGDDVFFLTLDELAEVLAGDKTSLSHIPARRQAYQNYCTLPPYPAMIIGRFDPFKWAADPSRRSDFYDARQIIASALVCHNQRLCRRGRLRGGNRSPHRPRGGW